MSKEIKEFIGNMAEQGRKVMISGEYVIIRPSSGISIADIMQMQRLNKRDALYKYLKNENQPS